MKAVKTFSKLALVAAMGVCSMAHADSGHLVGAAAHAKADAVFIQQADLTNTLVSTGTRMAGRTLDGTRLAKGVVHSLVGTVDGIELIVTQGEPLGGETMDNSNTSRSPYRPTFKIHGNNRSTDNLTVVLGGGSYGEANDDSPQQFIIANVTDADDGIVLTDYERSDAHDAYSAKGIRTASYDFSVYGDQNVPADTYTLATDAYIWQK